MLMYYTYTRIHSPLMFLPFRLAPKISEKKSGTREKKIEKQKKHKNMNPQKGTLAWFQVCLF